MLVLGTPNMMAGPGGWCRGIAALYIWTHLRTCRHSSQEFTGSVLKKLLVLNRTNPS